MFRINGKYKVTRWLILFFLLSIIYDGVFRKWLLAPFSVPLMMVKQVIAILICLNNFSVFPRMSVWEKSFIFVGTIAFLTTLAFGHQNLTVAIYGCLPFWFGLPICFIISNKIQVSDLIAYIKIVIYSSILNSVLMILQFQLSPSHILNYRGGEVDARIQDMSVSDMSGLFRPAGLFMHDVQSNLFMLLSLVLILYCLLFNKYIISRKTLIIAFLLEMFACVCSASRTCIFLHFGTILFFVFYCMKRKNLRILFKMSYVLIPILFIVTLSPVGNKAIDNLERRFTAASKVQSGNISTTEGTLNDLWNRNVVYNVEALINPHTMDGNSIPFMGYGQGLSTQIGGKILNLKMGKSGFALAEWDGLRIMCESGYILGWLIIFIRLGYVFRFIPRLKFYRKKNQFLTICLFLPFLMSFYLLNTWGNLFVSNFAFLVGGLFLSASKNEYQINNFILSHNEN